MTRPSKYIFAALFTKEADGGYSVSFPQLDGCYTQGDNFEEARRMAADAMSLHLYGMVSLSDYFPQYFLKNGSTALRQIT